MLNWLRQIWCAFFHKRVVLKHISGNYQHGVHLLECTTCKRRYVVSDTHQAVLCYSDDPKMAKELAFLYAVDIEVFFKQY